MAIKKENVDNAKNKFAELLSLVSFDIEIPCDFVLNIDDLDVGFIQTIDKYHWLWGTGVKEPKVAVENIAIRRPDIHIQGKDFNSVTFTVNDIKFVKFSMKENDPLLEWASAWDDDDNDEIVLNVVGEVSANEYKGTLTPQVIIKESGIIS